MSTNLQTAAEKVKGQSVDVLFDDFILNKINRLQQKLWIVNLTTAGLYFSRIYLIIFTSDPLHWIYNERQCPSLA